MKYLCPRDFRRGEMEEKMNKISSNEKLAIGICLGLAIGTVFDNIGIGLALGVAFGAIWGSTDNKDQK